MACGVHDRKTQPKRLMVIGFFHILCGKGRPSTARRAGLKRLLNTARRANRPFDNVCLFA